VWRNDSSATSVWELDGGYVIAAVSRARTDWRLLA
jgi:hypothetical protein